MSLRVRWMIELAERGARADAECKIRGRELPLPRADPVVSVSPSFLRVDRTRAFL